MSRFSDLFQSHQSQEDVFSPAPISESSGIYSPEIVSENNEVSSPGSVSEETELFSSEMTTKRKTRKRK